MTNEICIPLLPCHSIDETLTFYRALDFEVTYQQAKPNLYAVVQRGGIELHFFAMQGRLSRSRRECESSADSLRISAAGRAAFVGG